MKHFLRYSIEFYGAKFQKHLEMRFKLKVSEATKRYYLHLIVVHPKWSQTKQTEQNRR